MFEKITEILNWGLVNLEMVSSLIAVSLGILGILAEGFKILFPTKDKSSALEWLLSKLGILGKLVSLITNKLPQVLKKPIIGPKE